MPGSWKVLYTNLKTGDVLGQLPVESLSYTETLNRDGGFSISMPLVTTTAADKLDNQVSALQITDATLDVGATGIFFQRDQRILWGGLVWTIDADVAANTMNIAGAGLMSYFRHRFITDTTTYTATDQLEMARLLIDKAQAVGGGNIGVSTSDTNTSGVLRDRTYYGYEYKNFAEAITQLAEVQNGFDFYIDSFFDSNNEIASEFRSVYPATGRRTSFVFDIDNNCQALRFTVNGSSLGNAVYAIGAGNGEDMLRSEVTDTSGLAARPKLEKVTSHKNVSVTSTLQTHADRELSRSVQPVKTLGLTVYPDVDPVLGSYIVGDQVYVRGEYGYVTLDGWYRIVDLTVGVSAGQYETINLSLVQSEVFDE